MTSKALRQFVSQVGSGLTNSKGNLGNFQHGSRLFTDADHRLAPKVKFLYHVVFSIDQNALKSLNLKFQHENEINMLVKRTDLPKFQVATETLNQYNRKKVVQNKIEYQPVNITFHDDNVGVIRQLWENYYAYYYADSTTALKSVSAYQRNAMSDANNRLPYGFDNNSTVPFFKKITIYQMSKRKWASYTLVNPLITTWNHDTLSYSENTPVEHNMTVAYESVYYETGDVAQNNPPGFGVDHYDTVPSPISLPGGGTRTLFSQGGVLQGASSVFGDIASGKAFSDPLSFAQTAIKAVNTYNNAKSLTLSGVKEEALNIANKQLLPITAAGISGVKNTVFPVRDTGTTTINANQIKF